MRRHCSNCISIARYRPLFTGSHSSRNRFQISSPFTESLSLVIIWIARFFVCIMNASCFIRFSPASFIPSKNNSPNGFDSTSASSAQSYSSTASVSDSFPILRSTSFPLYSWAYWSSCRSCFIDHLLLIHQLVLLMSTTEQIPPSSNSDAAAPEYQKLPGSVNATTSSATMRTCDNMGRVFLSRCGARVNSQDHGQSQVHMSEQLNRGGQTTIHKLKTR